MPERLFAIGDIHGCFDALKELVENEIRLNKSDMLVFLGDYIDRGPHSKEVIDYIMTLQDSGFQIVPLRGNHEEMLLNALGNDNELSLWFYNGGNKTLLSFGITSPNHFDEKYISFFRSLGYYHIAGDFVFVHAGFNDQTDDPFNDRNSMVWECREKYKHPQLKNKTIVHGHCITKEKKLHKHIRKNMQTIPIDSGCVFEFSGFGYLTAIELYSKQLFRVRCNKTSNH